MPSQSITGASPYVYNKGFKDETRVRQVRDPEARPIHCPLIFFYAAKGRTKRELVSGGDRNVIYGNDTFDATKPFYNHQTELSQQMLAIANAHMTQRILPADIGPKANLLFSLDIVAGPVPQKLRGSDGRWAIDATTGLPTPAATPTAVGLIGKWVVTSVTSKQPGDTDADLFGVAVQGPGDQTVGQVTSTRFPIFEWWADSEGSVFNNSGIRLWAPTTFSGDKVDLSILANNKAYPFRLGMMDRENAISTASIQENLDSEPSMEFVLKLNQTLKGTTNRISLDKAYLPKYQVTTNKKLSPVYADFSGFHIYQDNLDEVLQMVYDLEKEHFGAGSDFTEDAEDEVYKTNIFSAMSSSGAQYYKFCLNTTDANATRLSEGTTHWAAGGDDGTMSNTLFSGLVAKEMEKYTDPLSYLMNEAVNIESTFYDTGFEVADKLKICGMIAERGDVYVNMSTCVAGAAPMTPSQEYSFAQSLLARLVTYVESPYFGTPACRAGIFARTGLLIGSQYDARVPSVYDVARMTGLLLGASNGIANPINKFDRYPGNLVTLMEDFSATWVNNNQRIKDWDVGINAPNDFNRSEQFWPALQTIYPFDDSGFNSYINMVLCCDLVKVGYRVHREITGAVDLDDAQLVNLANQKVQEQTNGKYADIIKVVPIAFLSPADKAAGYRWTLPIVAYMNKMKTVETLYVVGRNLSDLATA